MLFLYAILVLTNIRNKCTGFFTQITNKKRNVRGGESWKIKMKLRKIRNINMRPQEKKLCFGIGAIGKDAICNLVGAFLMLYFTDTLYLAPAFVGVLFL